VDADTGRASVPTSAVLVPVKSFAVAKERLSLALGAAERALLARSLAEGVLRAAGFERAAVVCDDAEVATWARQLGVEVVWAPGTGLNRAVSAGVAHLAKRGATRVTVVHADLPFPNRLRSLPEVDGVLLVPDRRDDGTNVLGLPVELKLKFSYGPGSFTRHLELAKGLGAPVTVLRDEELGIDIDLPEDLELARARTRPWGPEGPHASQAG
jgi:2-phospho-L-lactate guanylyltransferase